MAWALLWTAGVFEVGYASFLKLSNGFSDPLFTVLFAVCAIVSFGLLNLATQSIPLGTAYAVWTGIGAVGTALVGIVGFGDPAGGLRLVLLGLIVAAIVGLRLISESPAVSRAK